MEVDAVHDEKDKKDEWVASLGYSPTQGEGVRTGKAETRAKVTKARAMAKTGKAAATRARGLAPARVSSQWGLLPLLGFRALLPGVSDSPGA